MNATASWTISGLYFEACNCELVCPCYSAQPPTYGFCEGNLETAELVIDRDPQSLECPCRKVSLPSLIYPRDSAFDDCD